MTLRVKIPACTALQIRRAAEWWAENRPAAPGAVRTDIGDALALLAACVVAACLRSCATQG